MVIVFSESKQANSKSCARLANCETPRNWAQRSNIFHFCSLSPPCPYWQQKQGKTRIRHETTWFPLLLSPSDLSCLWCNGSRGLAGNEGEKERKVCTTFKDYYVHANLAGEKNFSCGAYCSWTKLFFGITVIPKNSTRCFRGSWKNKAMQKLNWDLSSLFSSSSCYRTCKQSSST